MTARRSAWLAARASPFLALLVALVLLPEAAVAYDIPYREPASDCYWWELRGVVGGDIKRLRVIKEEPPPPDNGGNGGK